MDRLPVPIARGTTLLVATTNAGKLREIQSMLAGLPLDIRALPSGADAGAAAAHGASANTASANTPSANAMAAMADIAAPEETGTTFAENARLKARYYADATGLLTVAEDSGLEIDALDGAPGIYSARYPGATYEERFRNLFAALEARGAVDPAQRSARFVCVLALAEPPIAQLTLGTDPILYEARGTVEGHIAHAPSGAGGFGYDPIFFYPPFGRTLAEVSDDEKARVSHRGAAFRQLRAFLEAHVR